ncbi:hypothetical protein M885DRAFT_509112 [Pelagophyceae sp. CCMP2097]|nr:hypothetical protein M885DRAFT_509112 [Pelagophyceae sp. CCMP2097]
MLAGYVTIIADTSPAFIQPLRCRPQRSVPRRRPGFRLRSVPGTRTTSPPHSPRRWSGPWAKMRAGPSWQSLARGGSAGRRPQTSRSGRPTPRASRRGRSLET